MATIDDFVTVYESSDGGSGNPAKTFWQFFVGKQPVTTENHQIAETIRLAIKTNNKVQVTFDENDGNTISQVRMEFVYICEPRTVESCDPTPGPPIKIHQTYRYTPFKPGSRRSTTNKNRKGKK